MPIYSLRGVDVQFPYDAYPCQLDYMSSVIAALQEKKNALLESPTGTGKTLCLLCATLAWRESLKQEIQTKKEEIQANPHPSHIVQALREDYAEYKAESHQLSKSLSTIIYASRTHSQIKQVMNELAMTSYNPTTAVLGSRQQGCLNPSIQALPAAALNQACKALTANRQCPWHNNTDRFLRKNETLNTEVMDIEDIIKVGTQRKVCPYYLCRSMSITADVVFMPYNYLIDQNTRGGLSISWDNSILIFDEAHNVEHVCSEAASFDIPAAVIAGAIEEAGTASELALAKIESVNPRVADEFGHNGNIYSYHQLGKELRSLQLVLQKLEEEIANIKLNPKDGFTAPGSFLFKLLSKINLTPVTWQAMSKALDEATSMLTDEAINGGRLSSARTSFYRLHALREALTLAFSTYSDDDSKNGQRGGGATNIGCHDNSPAHHAYRVHVHMESRNKEDRPTPTLSYWCFSPGLSMKALSLLGVRSIILTSGTLSPLGSFAQELSIPFEIRLENPHVIDQSQVWIGILSKGPQNSTLSSSYHNRNTVGYKEDLGNAIVNFARIVPDGLLVFFPSYSLLNDSIQAWKAPGIGGASVWERIVQYKAPVIEPREAGMFPAAAADFRAKLDNPSYKGAIFFAVCRGKASEGLDFSDRAGRAVIITGIPYATKIDPKVQIKQSVLNDNLRQRHFEKERAKRMQAQHASRHASSETDNNKNNQHGEGIYNCDEDDPLSGDAWYVQQAIRAVNQAMGRVIRHKGDFGAIILCDERFKGDTVRKQLSRWLRDQVQVFDKYGNASLSLTRFFKDQAEKLDKGITHLGGQRPVQSNVHGKTVLQGEKTTFQIAGRNAGLAQNTMPLPSAREQQERQSLMQSVPAAMDMAGIADLISSSSGAGITHQQQQCTLTAAAAAATTTTSSGNQNKRKNPEANHDIAADNQKQQPPHSRLLGILHGRSEHDVKGIAQDSKSNNNMNAPSSTSIVDTGGIDGVLASSPAIRRPGGSSLRALGAKPWEKTSVVVGGVLPSQSRMMPASKRGDRGTNSLSVLQSKMSNPLNSASNAVGPAHVLQKLQEKKGQQQGRLGVNKESVGGGDRGGGEARADEIARDREQDGVTKANSTTVEQHEEVMKEIGQVIHREPSNDDSIVAAKSDPKTTATTAEKNKANIAFLDRLKLELPENSSQKIFDALHLYRTEKDPTPLVEVAAAEFYPEERRVLRMEFRKFLPRVAQSRFDTRVAQLAGMKDPLRVRCGGTAAVASSDDDGLKGHGTTSQRSNSVRAADDASKQQHDAEAYNRYHRDGWRGFDGASAVGSTKVIGKAEKAPVVVLESSKRAGKGQSGSMATAGGHANKQVAGVASRQASALIPCSECKKIPMDAPFESKCCGRLCCYGCWIKMLSATSGCTLCKKPLKKNMLMKKFFITGRLKVC